MNEQTLFKLIEEVLDTSFSKNTFHQIYKEDKNSFINYYLLLDSDLGIILTIDFMDRLITFSMIRLKEGQVYKSYHFPDVNDGTIMLYFQSILNYFQFTTEKRSPQLMCFKAMEDIPELLRKNIEYYKPIFQNERGVLTELHKRETWEQIKQ